MSTDQANYVDEWFEISCDCEGSPDYGAAPTPNTDTLFGLSTKFLCFAMTAQSACKRLSKKLLPPDFSLENASMYTIRFEKANNGHFWAFSLNSKFRAIAPNTKLFVGEFKFFKGIMSEF